MDRRLTVVFWMKSTVMGKIDLSMTFCLVPDLYVRVASTITVNCRKIDTIIKVKISNLDLSL